VTICAHKVVLIISIGDGVKLSQCNKCGLIYNDKFLKKRKSSGNVYVDYYRNEIGDEVGRFRFGLEYVVKIFRFIRAFRVVTLAGIGKDILDIGCGRGWMLFYLKKFFGYKRTAATQISRPAWIFAKEKLGLEVYDKDILELKIRNNSFDVVTIWHVLEHVDDPLRYFPLFFRLLRPKGRLMIEVPNFESWTRKFTGIYWLGLDLKYHRTYYSVESLKKFVVDQGFDIQKVQTFSLEYSTFVSAQSLASKITRTDQLFFRMTQGEKVGLTVLLDIFLICFLVPISFVVNLALYRTKWGEVVVLIAKKPEV